MRALVFLILLAAPAAATPSDPARPHENGAPAIRASDPPRRELEIASPRSVRAAAIAIAIPGDPVPIGQGASRSTRTAIATLPRSIALGHAQSAPPATEPREPTRDARPSQVDLGPRSTLALVRTDPAQGAELEVRVRALESLARARGHATGSGSLEERVSALERVLAASPAAPTPSRGAKRLRVLDTIHAPSVRRFYVSPDGEMHALPAPAPLEPAVEPAPLAPRASPRTQAATPAPAMPAPAAPAPLAPSTPRAPEALDDVQREDLADALRALRAETETLRAEVQRMRERIESLPRAGPR